MYKYFNLEKYNYLCYDCLFYEIWGIWGLGIGDWGLGIGDWGLGQSPIPNPQSPYSPSFKIIFNFKNSVNIYL
jgi:hypothetical protein